MTKFRCPECGGRPVKYPQDIDNICQTCLGRGWIKEVPPPEDPDLTSDEDPVE